MKRTFSGIALLLIILIQSCATAPKSNRTQVDPKAETETPKNVILLIGDGMGLSQISAGIYFSETPSNFEMFSTVGLIKTSASSDLITDSAAGATAFSAGVKTFNGAIGVDAEGRAVPTLVETASERGLATGIIATSSVVHATPASFFAHVRSRRFYDEIATYLSGSELDFVAGGGRKFFTNREDGRDLYTELVKNGYTLHTETLPASAENEKPVILLAEDGMPKMTEGRGDFLPNATKLALENLSAEDNGFFLMIEGSQIDWGGHANDAAYLIGEQLDFDKTIGVALAYANANPETLVIVTADHETGGFTLAADEGDYNAIKPSFSTGGHSATLIPVFAKGPGEEKFGGVYENTAVYEKIRELLLK
ncbi:MAG: alkaline phosphatase [Flavobacteriaceae bacterium]|nr:alkaline phosphatase [Flavobacteriaceae bacterium]